MDYPLRESGLAAAEPAIAADEWAASETLHRMASVDRYNDWIFRKLRRHIGRRLLEVGCGLGNMTPYFLGADSLVCLDLNPDSVALVGRTLADHPNLRVLQGDVCDEALLPRLAATQGDAGFDTVACVNVLEHIRDDARALRNMLRLTAPGGMLLLFVPAGQYLFGQLDRSLGHYRRYSLAPLVALVEAQGYRVEEAFYMNVAGIPGWFVSSRILRRDVPPRGLLWLFNLLAPLFIWLEEALRPSFGQSIVCVARRP